MKYLTVNEAAKKYGVSTATLIRRLKDIFQYEKYPNKNIDGILYNKSNDQEHRFSIPETCSYIPMPLNERRQIINKRFIKLNSGLFVYGIKFDILEDIEFIIPIKHHIEQSSTKNHYTIHIISENNRNRYIPDISWIDKFFKAIYIDNEELLENIASLSETCSELEITFDKNWRLAQITYLYPNSIYRFTGVSLIGSNLKLLNNRCLLREYY